MESFTDSYLVELALAGDREGIAEVCELVSIRLKLPNERLLQGFDRIGQGLTPDMAFEWHKRGHRKDLKHESRLILEDFSLGDICNDADLYSYVLAVLRDLKIGKSPDEAFKWRQKNRGRRLKSCNALRDWDICMTVHRFMKEGFSFSKSCEWVANITSLDFKTIQAIARSTSIDIEPPFPDSIYPLPKSQLIQQNEIDVMIRIFKKPLKIKQ